MSQSKEMREQRCKLIADAREIMDSAEVLDAEQRSQVDAMLNDSDTLKKDIDRIEAIENEERALKASAGKTAELSLAEPVQEERATGIKSKEYRDAFWTYIRNGKAGMSDAEAKAEAKKQARFDALWETLDLDNRTQVTGKVLCRKYKVNAFGGAYKMLVELDSGIKIWGTDPSICEVGDVVQFDCRLQRSDRDMDFGFFKRPTKLSKT